MTYIEQFWRDATAADVARVMAGETVEARFRDRETEEWISPERLVGIKFPHGNAKLLWICGSYGWWFCQVYAPPQWFLDKPEPGEGYRLLEKFPDEAKLVTDEVYLKDIQHWQQIGVDDGKQQEGYWYRRRIEQPKPEPKYTLGQRVKIVGPKRTEKVRYNWEQGMDNQVGKTGVVTGSHDGSFGRLYQLSGIVEWNFQEDYLEHFVEPKHYVLKVGDTAETESGLRIKITEHGVEVS